MLTVTSYSALLLHTSKSKMESFEENNGDKDKLLEPPRAMDLYTEEDDVKATIKPRLSPLPRRRTSSVSSDDGELEPPPTVARKVSFADAFGFDLVSVKEFDTWDVPIVSTNFEIESVKIEEFYLTSSFILPPIGCLMERLHTKKVLLESVDFIPSTTAMKGIIRVLNLSYEKQVYVRMSFDEWQSFYDLLADYIPGSTNGNTDQFGFTISFASPYQKEGAKVEFCLCYETSVGTFWDNNDGSNYVLTCQKKEQFVEVVKPLEDDKNKKSCLKAAVSKEDEDVDVCAVEEPAITDQLIPRIICSHDEYTEDNHDEEKENNGVEKNNEDESDLEVFLSQRLMKARITSSEEQQNIESSDRFNLQTEKEQDNEMKYYTSDDSKTQDHFSQESQSYDKKEEHPPVSEPTSSLAAEDFLATPNTSHHFAEALSQEYSRETEEPAFYPELQKDTTSDCWLQKSESPTFPQGENMEVTEILDHNANPSCSENPVHMTYFSTDNTEEMQYEHSENLKTETESQEDNVLTENDMTEGFGRQHPIIFSQLDDYQDLSCQYKPSNTNDPETEHAESNQSALSLASSYDSYSFRESKVEEIGEETSQNRDVITGFHTDWKALDDMSDLSDEKMYVPAEDTDLYDFQSVPLQISKQYFVTTQNLGHTDQEADKKHVMHDRNVILSDNDESYDVTYSSYEDRGKVTDQTDRTVYESTVTESLPESPPSIACSTAENVTLGTLHVWNEILGTFPSEVTPGNKVIIAKFTEEKGQSETCSQGTDDSKRSYIDVCDSGSAAQLADSSAKSKLKRGDIDHTSKPMPIPCDREGTDDIEGERLDTSSLRALSEEGFFHEGTKYTPKELGKYQFESKLNDVSESDIHHEEQNPVIASSESFTELREDKDVTLWQDFANKTNGRKVAEYVDLGLKVIPEEDMDYEQDSPEQSFIGPSILISEPDDEEESQCTDTEEQVKPEDTHQYYYPFADNETHTDQEITTDTETTEHLDISRASSKVLCFIMFVVFAGLMYHYDFLVCFALYLFSLYWLYWEGDRGKTLVRKE